MKKYLAIFSITFAAVAFGEGAPVIVPQPGTPVISAPLNPGQCVVACVPSSTGGGLSGGLGSGFGGIGGGTSGGICKILCNPLVLPKVPSKDP